MSTAVAVNIRRICLDVPQMTRLVRSFAPDVTEARVRAWQGRGLLRVAGKKPVLNFAATEALRALLFTLCQQALGIDSPVATAIASEASEDDLQVLASDESPTPTVSVVVGRFNYGIPIERGVLDDVLRQLDELPR